MAEEEKTITTTEENFTTPKEETTSGESTPVENIPSEEKTIGDSEQELRAKQGIQLLEALQDPNTSHMVIQQLAQQAGLKLVQPGQQQETKAPGTIQEELAEALGPDWKFLADQIGPVLAKRLQAIEERAENRVEELQNNTRKLSLKAAEQQFFKENPQARRFFKGMKSLAYDYPPPENKDYIQYFNDLHNMASAGKGSISESVESKRNKRSKRNLEEADVKNSGRGNEMPKPSGNKHFSIKEAVAYAKQTIKNTKDD